MGPVDPETWLEFDEHRTADLALKVHIFANAPDAFMADPDTEAAQAEVLQRIAAHLAARGVCHCPAANTGDPPLRRAALMVQDDLVLMRRRDDAWHLAAAALCFPSSWSLMEKFGKPMDALHDSVPGWAGSMAARVKRIFDNLPLDRPVGRLNWSLQFGDALRMAKSKAHTHAVINTNQPLFVRVERQTLIKLPRSGDILFTIRIHLDRVDAFAHCADGPRLADALAAAIADLSADELAYKGLTGLRSSVLSRIASVAATDRPLVSPALRAQD